MTIVMATAMAATIKAAHIQAVITGPSPCMSSGAMPRHGFMCSRAIRRIITSNVAMHLRQGTRTRRAIAISAVSIKVVGSGIAIIRRKAITIRGISKVRGSSTGRINVANHPLTHHAIGVVSTPLKRGMPTIVVRTCSAKSSQSTGSLSLISTSVRATATAINITPANASAPANRRAAGASAWISP